MVNASGVSLISCPMPSSETPMGSLDSRIWLWCILSYSDHYDMRHHVRLFLEGILIHAWNESIAKQAVARV